MLKDFAYHALADLVYRGALFINAEFAGYSFVFKTVNEREYGLIRLRAGSQKRVDYDSRFNAAYLAYSVFMVNGENVLKGDRGENLNTLINFFNTIPAVLFNRILNEIINLRSSLMDISTFMEGFCYTQQSKQAWDLLGSSKINDDDFTGIQGMKAIGLNIYQENWIQVNQMLDEEEAYNQKLHLALLIASASNPKGSRKIRAQHDSSVQTIKDKRKTVAKEGFSRKSSWSEQGWALPVDTAEELVAELERQMSGLKDKHDLLVEEYLKGLQDESDKVVFEEKQKMEESQKRHEGEPLITGSQRALTPDETKDMLAKRGNNNLLVLPSEETVTVEERDRFYKKVGTKILTPKN